MTTLRRLAVPIALLVAFASITILFVGRADNTASAAEGRGGAAQFTGLWQAIQANDGSLATYSISDVDRDGVFTVNTHEFFLSTCGGDFGIIVGTAIFDDAGALVEDGTLTCPSGSVFDFTTVFTYVPQFDLLLRGGVAAPPDAVPEVLHRISSR